MKTKILVFFLLLHVDQVVFSQDSDFIKCPLAWEPAVAGDDLPTGAISSTSFGTTHFICRVKIETSDSFVIGRYSTKQDSAFIATSSSVEKTQYFEILTNPNNCILEWKTGASGGTFAVPASTGSNHYVGRTVISPEVVLSGDIYGGKITVVSDDGLIVQSPSSFEILRSYSKGLTLTMTDFIFEEDLIGSSTDMLGIDEIHNNANTDVKQTISHTKILSETSIVKVSSGWSRTYKVGLSWEPTIKVPLGTDVPLPVKVGMSMDYAFSHGADKNSEIRNEKETQISVTREVNLPPYTSVQVCSTIAMKDNFETGFVAKAEYSAPGLTGEEILQVLKEDGKTGGIVKENSVIIEESGTLGGSMSLTTQFIVVPYDTQGCSQLQSKIASLRNTFNHSDVAQKYEDVQKFVTHLIKKKM